MNMFSSIRAQRGFSLIEVLASLGLCALLAAATASAIAFSARAEQGAAREGEASLLVSSLYAAQRLRPGDPPETARGWRIEQTSVIVPLPEGGLREWHRLDVAARGGEIQPFMLMILDDTP